MVHWGRHCMRCRTCRCASPRAATPVAQSCPCLSPGEKAKRWTRAVSAHWTHAHTHAHVRLLRFVRRPQGRFSQMPLVLVVRALCAPVGGASVPPVLVHLDVCCLGCARASHAAFEPTVCHLPACAVGDKDTPPDEAMRVTYQPGADALNISLPRSTPWESAKRSFASLRPMGAAGAAMLLPSARPRPLLAPAMQYAWICSARIVDADAADVAAAHSDDGVGMAACTTSSGAGMGVSSGDGDGAARHAGAERSTTPPEKGSMWLAAAASTAKQQWLGGWLGRLCGTGLWASAELLWGPWLRTMLPAAKERL